ncbi:MAG: chorismate mutase [Rhodospirillales bacterium]
MNDNKTKEQALSVLRRKIDKIDDSIHDLLMRRTEVVKEVRKVKHGEKIKIRPARETEIVTRLVKRHKGPFPKRELVRIWREIIVATLAFEGPFSVAVCRPDGEDGFWDLARDQYGTFTAMNGYASPRRVIDAVHSNTNTIGVLPLPAGDDDDPWWRHLAVSGDDIPKVIDRLPISGPGNGLGRELESLVICPTELEPSGRDRTLFVFETNEDVSIRRIKTKLTEAGLDYRFTSQWNDDPKTGVWLNMAEIDGFVAGDDSRLGDFGDSLGPVLSRIIPIGGYALPFSRDEMAGPQS